MDKALSTEMFSDVYRHLASIQELSAQMVAILTPVSHTEC
jgi:hypothetical protein